MSRGVVKPKALRKTCACCGAPVVEYSHTLSTAMVEILWIAWAQGNGDWRQAFKVSGNDVFTYSQASNFQKLRYWGLVEKTDEASWQCTTRGEDFLRGEASVPKRVWTFRGQIATHRTDLEELVNIQSIAPDRLLPGRREYARTAQRAIDENQQTLLLTEE